MEKIDTFMITSLTAEGFKCFAEPRRFDLGSMTTVTGHNAQGKSTVADAIAYAITGCAYYGSEQSLDRLYALGSKNMSVELTLETSDGATHTLARTRRNDETSATYDGVSVKQSDLIAMFGEKDVFLSIFNPLYFIEVLGTKGRNLLERHLPPASREDILARIGENARKLLENQPMKSPDALLENVRAEIRELDDAVIYAEGQRDLLSSQALERTTAAIKKRAELKTLDAAIAELEARRAENLDFDAMQSNLDALYTRYNEISYSAMPRPDTSATDAKIQETQAALAKRRAEEYASQYTAQTAETEAAIAHLRAQYTKETAVMNNLKPGITCPTCKQEVTEHNIDAIRKSFADSIAEITREGTALTAKLKDLKELDAKSKAVFEAFRSDDVTKMEAEMEELRLQRLEIISNAASDAPDRAATLDALKGEIQSLELDIRFGNLPPPDGLTLESHREDRERLASELTSLEEQQNAATPDRKTADVDTIKDAIKAKRELEEAIKYYIAERASIMLSGFSQLNRASVVLYEPVKKTGAAKDVFKFSYDGRPYQFLSQSEKVKAGLEISELMKRLTGRNYPVFIDNGESVPVIDNVRPTGQVIVAQVAKGASLKVDILSAPAPAPMPKAA